MGTSDKSAQESKANSKNAAILSIIDKFIEESENNKVVKKSESGSESQSKSVSYHSANHNSNSCNDNSSSGSSFRIDSNKNF